MMSLQAWIALLLFYIVYLLIGGWTFKEIEGPRDCSDRLEAFNTSLELSRKIEILRGNKTFNTRAFMSALAFSRARGERHFQIHEREVSVDLNFFD